jgi:hypothetical protein
MCPSITTSGWDDPGGHGRATDERFNVIASTQRENSLPIRPMDIKQHLLFVGGKSRSSDDAEASVSRRSRPSDLVLNTSLDLLDLLELYERLARA